MTISASCLLILRWVAAAQLTPIWDRYVPEGDSGHSLILARAI